MFVQHRLGIFLAILLVLLLHAMSGDCRIIQCYSCSDCGNATLSTLTRLRTTGEEDWCMKTTLFTGSGRDQQRLVSRGASSRCQTFANEQISIVCCNSDLCNA